MCLTVLLFKVLSVKMFSLIVFLEELQVIFQLLEVFSKFFQTPDFFFSKSAFSQTGSKSLNDLI